MSFNIAIDGPAGAGKSTIAKRVASSLSFIYVDTGAMYRAMALYLHRNGVSIRYQDNEQVVLLNGENVNPYLRTEEVSRMASKSSAVPEVRAHLLALQRNLASTYNVVMDGRDIGTVILPDAQVKIFLTASPETRAKRRYEELIQKGQEADYQEVLTEIINRDARDMNRETAPLKQAEDAFLVDSSDMTLAEVEETICKIVRERMGENKE